MRDAVVDARFIARASLAEIRRHYPAVPNPTLVPNGVDVRPFGQVTAAAVAAARDRYQLPPVFILAVGAHRPHKNHEVLVRALAAVFCAASVFAFPSLAEGYGLPVLEAMAAGVPVVMSDIEVLAEVAGPAALMVPPRDVGGWASAESIAHHFALVRWVCCRGDVRQHRKVKLWVLEGKCGGQGRYHYGLPVCRLAAKVVQTCRAGRERPRLCRRLT
jgi:glycosyltransferase involved in cell wall biosynthesis